MSLWDILTNLGSQDYLLIQFVSDDQVYESHDKNHMFISQETSFLLGSIHFSRFNIKFKCTLFSNCGFNSK